jgi:hypothetical protein
MNLLSGSVDNTMRRPLSAIPAERTMIMGMCIANIQHFVVWMHIDIIDAVGHGILRILTSQGTRDKIVKHIHNYVGLGMFIHGSTLLL